jgi:hypothetical protein
MNCYFGKTLSTVVLRKLLLYRGHFCTGCTVNKIHLEVSGRKDFNPYVEGVTMISHKTL